MNKQTGISGIGLTRDDFIPVEHYIDPAFAKLENEKLWTKVWQMAGRIEHLSRVGDYFIYDIADQSIIVVRTAEDRIQAYYNVCRHRGRPLAAGRGNARNFRCNYHGWTWAIDGSIQKVSNREDWAGCPAMADSDLALDEVKVDSWGGFVFINMDKDSESLADFLGPVPAMTGWFKWEDLRYTWHRSFTLKCNWKTALEAFMESYHVTSTHSQYAKYQDSTGHSRAHGNHGQTGYWGNPPIGYPSPDSTAPQPDDVRVAFIEALEALTVQVGNFPQRDIDAVKRIMTETTIETPLEEVFMAAEQFMKEAAEAEGIVWPECTPEEFDAFGAFWNISPNVSLVPGTKSGTVVMRTRPNGDDPNSCIFDVGAMLRFPADKPPVYDHVMLNDWRDEAKEMPLILVQDFGQVELVQKGMKSKNFKFSRMNPEQERQITNMHRLIERYVYA